MYNLIKIPKRKVPKTANYKRCVTNTEIDPDFRCLPFKSFTCAIHGPSQTSPQRS
jgi:hypothetical protein